MKRFAIGLLMTIQASLLAYGAAIHSPNYDETAHLPAGLAIWHTGRFASYPHNPPLVKAVAAVPVAFARPRLVSSHTGDSPLLRPEFKVGQEFIGANGERSFWLFTLARWACIPLSVLGGWACYRWASQLYGVRAGFLSLSLWVACPNVLANGQLITPDAAAASLGLLAGFAFWRWLRCPTWPSAWCAGLALGVAELAKFTWLVLLVLWPIIWLWQPRPARAHPRQFATILLLALYVLNLGYLFEGTGRPLGDFEFFSEALSGERIENDADAGSNRFAGAWLSRVPVPLPADYVRGIDLQKRDFERGFKSYLAGAWKHGGWWYYYLYGLAIKVPLGVWALMGALLIARLRRSAPIERARDEAVLLAPALTVLALVSSQTGFSHHLRYVLPVLPFVYVWLGQLALVRQGWQKLLLVLALAWSAFSSLSVYPHSGSYFNELVGGPLGGPRHLVDSNLGWGQDLLLLKRWLAAHACAAQTLNLVYFGNFDPRAAGLEFRLPPRLPKDASKLAPNRNDSKRLVPGLYVVDASFVYGMNRVVPDGAGHWSFAPSADCDFSYFREFTPHAFVGYSLYVYELGEADIERLRHARRLPPERLANEPPDPGPHAARR